tara:strand:+ start:2255 stop:2713 length:459 start_codon:yes stop_codon:yes gene_type:complete
MVFKHDFIKFPELTNSQMQIYYFDSPHRQITEDFTALVTKIIDGDTIQLKWSERNFEFPIRFIKIAAPEKKESGGEESKNWLEKELLGETVDIIINNKKRVGKWGRLLGEVFAKGVNMGDLSMTLGFSEPFSSQGAGKIRDIDKGLKRFKIK